MIDIILTNANVITLDQECPRAQLIAVKDGRILSVGRTEDLDKLRQESRVVIDVRGKTILPGFIDAHCHLIAFAESLVTLDVKPQNNIRSIADIQAAIQQKSCDAAPGVWIKGRGYNEFYLREKRHPLRWDLDSATTIHPVKLTHRSGRAHVLNSLALRLAGISKETPDPPGGFIDRDMEAGEPTGLLYGMGDYLAKSNPPRDREQMEQGIKMVSRQLSSWGITSIHDASPRNNLNRWRMFQRWIREGILKQRINFIMGSEGFKEYRKLSFPSSAAENQLRIGGVKIIVHETTGRLSPGQEALNEMVHVVHEAGLPAVLHAIEGKAIDAACDAIEYTLGRSHRSDHRHRIEHCSVCPESLARRIASLGIRVVTQPSFIYYNGERYLRTVPKPNITHLYPIATLKKNGVKVIGSSDFPIVPPNPMMGIYAAVSRKAENGELVLPEERISASEAVRMYTDHAAELSHEETMKGSIKPGSLADLVVLSHDPLSLPPDEIKNIRVEMTILKGEVVWDMLG